MRFALTFVGAAACAACGQIELAFLCGVLAGAIGLAELAES